MGNSFKVNGQCLNPFLENFNRQESIEELVDPVYPGCPFSVISVLPFVYSFSFIFHAFL